MILVKKISGSNAIFTCDKSFVYVFGYGPNLPRNKKNVVTMENLFVT